MLPPSEEVNALLVSRETTPLSSGARLSELMKRPQLGYEGPCPSGYRQTGVGTAGDGTGGGTEIRVIRRTAAIDEMRRLENRCSRILWIIRPSPALRKEAQEKLRAGTTA